ncbi:MAG: hypothetical protein ACRDJE_03180 [Dehalococcoidia bacterium]
MTQSPQPPLRWQVWLVGLGDYLRTPAGAVRFFTSKEEADQTAREVGGIVQVEGAPMLGGFDRALS